MKCALSSIAFATVLFATDTSLLNKQNSAAFQSCMKPYVQRVRAGKKVNMQLATQRCLRKSDKDKKTYTYQQWIDKVAKKTKRRLSSVWPQLSKEEKAMYLYKDCAYSDATKGRFSPKILVKKCREAHQGK